MEINLALTHAATVIGECTVIAGVLIPVVVQIKKLTNGTRCQLRNDMLAIYYKHKKSKTIPQFEYENFVALYDAYKALKGNSFVDKLYSDIKGWDISSEEEEDE